MTEIEKLKIETFDLILRQSKLNAEIAKLNELINKNCDYINATTEKE